MYQRHGWKLLGTRDVSGRDLVYSLCGFPYSYMAARSAKKAGLPFLMGVQGTYGVAPLHYFPERHLLKRSYRQSETIIVPSLFTKETIERHAGETYPISIVHNGVHFERFQRRTNIEVVKNRFAGKNILLTVGGLKSRKGQDLVIRALPEVLKTHPQTAYVIVGDGSDRQKLEKLAEETGVSDNVVFAGSKGGDELVSYFQACDVYVHTPRMDGLHFEGFGIVYLEASACRKPIVATDAGGIRDAVLDGETGLVGPPEDVPALAKNIVTLLNDEALRARMGEKGYRYAQDHDWPIIAARYRDIFLSHVHA